MRRVGTSVQAVFRAAAAANCRDAAAAGSCGAQALQAASRALLASTDAPAAVLGAVSRGFHSSVGAQAAAKDLDASTARPPSMEPPRKYRPLADKELWHEAWMYEDKFGSEKDPTVVPSLENERIIGVTDPEDDNLVVWGILRANDPPRQFVEGGEYYVLKVVPYVTKVGDVLEQLEGSKAEGALEH